MGLKCGVTVYCWECFGKIEELMSGCWIRKIIEWFWQTVSGQGNFSTIWPSHSWEKKPALKNIQGAVEVQRGRGRPITSYRDSIKEQEVWQLLHIGQLIGMDGEFL